MSKQVLQMNRFDGQLFPVVEDGMSLEKSKRGLARESSHCSAPRMLLTYAMNLHNTSFNIEWNSDKKTFVVRLFTKPESEVLPEMIKEIPLKIAQTSTCSCGEKLTLGDYSVGSSDGGFSLDAVYFCTSCKESSQLEKSGFKTFIKGWFSSLKKIEIKPTGFNIERK